MKIWIGKVILVIGFLHAVYRIASNTALDRLRSSPFKYSQFGTRSLNKPKSLEPVLLVCRLGPIPPVKL